MSIKQFLPCVASELLLGDVIFMDGEVSKIVRLTAVNDEVFINIDIPSRKGEYRGCKSTFKSEVGILASPEIITTVLPKSYRLSKLIELSDEEIEAVQALPLLSIY